MSDDKTNVDRVDIVNLVFRTQTENDMTRNKAMTQLPRLPTTLWGDR